MDVLLLIILNVIFPVFSLIITGALLHRKFTFDMHTFAKINTFLLMPAVSFANVYQSSMSGNVLIKVLGFLILQNGCLILLSTVTAKLSGFDRSLASTFKNSIVLSNSGNFGLPISQLVFYNNPLGLSIQVVIMIFQNLLTYTYGLFNCVSVESKGFKTFKVFLKNPVVYAFLLGILLNALKFEIPTFLWTPIENTANAFLAIALITLGAQSAYIKVKKIYFPLIASLVGRLIISPLIALLIILILHLEGTTAQALFIASSFPTSRNSSLIALEYSNHPEYAAQTVLLSTLLSIITVTAVVYVAQTIY